MDAKKQRKSDWDTAQEVARILSRRDLKGVDATNELIPILYNELRRMAE